MKEVWAPYMAWMKRRPTVEVDLMGSNLLPVGVDGLPGAREALELAGPNDEGYLPMREAVAERYGADPECVVLAPGASGANFLALGSLVRPGDEVLVEEPAYDPLVGAARFLGARVRRFRRRYEEDFAVVPEAVREALSPRTRVVVLTNLHNPTGVFTRPGTVAAVAAAAEEVGAWLLVDEVYLETLHPPPPPAAVAVAGGRVVSTSSLTKAYGLSGLRAGWALAPPELAEAMRRVRDVVDGVGAFPAERLAHLAFRHLDRLAERARGILLPNLERLQELVESRPELEWVPPAGGSVGFPRLRGRSDAEPFVRRLREEYGVGVVPGAFFGAPAHFRVAVGGDPGALARGLSRIARALEEGAADA